VSVKNYIFDIDGTLSIVGDRVNCMKTIPPNWDEFYERCGEDKYNDPVIDLLLAISLSPNAEIYLLTGRRESCRLHTITWLERVGLWRFASTGRLLMRPDGDFRHDTVVKPELLEKAGIKPYVVFEDRNSMVEYWRGQGVTCIQVAPGDF